MKIKCPECGGRRISHILNNTVVSRTIIGVNGNLEPVDGKIKYYVTVEERFACETCGTSSTDFIEFVELTEKEMRERADDCYDSAWPNV